MEQIPGQLYTNRARQRHALLYKGLTWLHYSKV